ncbi:hypothetical protein ACFX13_030997 [Malus domestica]
MSGPSDRRFDLNLVKEAATPSSDNIWRPSFLSPTGPLTVGDSVMKNDMTAAVVARNLLLEMCPKASHVMILYGHFTC